MPPRSVLQPACSPPLQYRSLYLSHLPPPAPPFPPAFISTERANFETFFHLSFWPLPWGSSDVEAVRTLRQVQFHTTNIYPTPPPCQALSQAWGHHRDDSTKDRAGEGAQSVETDVEKEARERLGRQRRVLRGHVCYRGPGLCPSSLVPRVMDSANTDELSHIQHYSRKCRNGDDKTLSLPSPGWRQSTSDYVGSLLIRALKKINRVVG